ncbi:MAG: alanine racemase [Desulfitobacteriaceae bacterium]|nr:alanine racemase [Desulfitobacteriaceae bacterium]MDI6913632.1 alanine racemase [Desulfitobacteriaceae bacterium]
MNGAWIDVDLDAVRSNYRSVLGLLHPGARVMAVVKADAYGLGAVEVARTLQGEGCSAFAVTTVVEGLLLREHGIKGVILVLGPADRNELPQALTGRLHLTLSSIAQLEALQDVAEQMEVKAEVHLKLETGMGRTGFSPEELPELARCLLDAHFIKAEGTYTHLARAGQRDQAYTKNQYDQFIADVNVLAKAGIEPRWKHVCNSAGFLDYPEWHLDFVRVGTLLIGHLPGLGFRGRLTLTDPWAARCRIISLRKVPQGTHVGYQSVYRTRRETQLAVIPLGYADGFGVEPRLIPQGLVDLLKIFIKNTALWLGFSLGQDKLTLNGHVVRVAGKIGMQLTVLDVGLQACRLGDVVEVPLRRASANPRLPRRYWSEGRILSERCMKEGFLLLSPEYPTSAE